MDVCQILVEIAPRSRRDRAEIARLRSWHRLGARDLVWPRSKLLQTYFLLGELRHRHADHHRVRVVVAVLQLPRDQAVHRDHQGDEQGAEIIAEIRDRCRDEMPRDQAVHRDHQGDE